LAHFAWTGHDPEFKDNPSPLSRTVPCFALAATRSTEPFDLMNVIFPPPSTGDAQPGPAPAIGLERFEMDRGQAFDGHVHDQHQLAWSSSGVLAVDTADRCWTLPSHLALWIPAGVRHTTAALRASVLEGIYLDPARCPLSWTGPRALSVAPLARHLIEYLAADPPVAAGARAAAEAVLFDVLGSAAVDAIELPLPADGRARDVARLLLADPADQRGLAELARAVGSSPRTLLRLFLAETGLTFSQWRTHARLQAAVAALADGSPVARVAEQVGYATPSAFTAAFRRVTGQTPAGYVAGHEASAGGA
jgi:AraC-like DNA-binding protein